VCVHCGMCCELMDGLAVLARPQGLLNCCLVVISVSSARSVGIFLAALGCPEAEVREPRETVVVSAESTGDSIQGGRNWNGRERRSNQFDWR
jgi:hypothetical protein